MLLAWYQVQTLKLYYTNSKFIIYTMAIPDEKDTNRMEIKT